MSTAAVLATRYARRPLLLEPGAAREIALQVRAMDSRAFARPSRLGALFSKLKGSSTAHMPSAMEDDGGEYAPVPLNERLAYSPLYIGEPEDIGFCWSLYQGVALMNADTPLTDRGEEFCGVIYHGYDTLLAGMRDATADERVKGIFLRLRCPGGVVAGGLPALAAFMRSARATGNSAGKPIFVYADMAASAAYWIAAQADRISAPAVGLVGSIGAVLVLEDWSAAYDKAGVVVNSIQFGAEKTAGADWQPLSASAREDFQAEIDQCGRDFVADVSLGRPQLSPLMLLGTEARVFLASHDDPTRSGLALGFVDAIESEEEAFQALLNRIAEPVTILSTAPPIQVAASAPLIVPNAAKEPTIMTKTALRAGVSASALTRAAAAVGRTPASAETSVDTAADGAAATKETDPCPTCDGSGEVAGADCPDCGGTGVDPAAGPAAESQAEAPAQESADDKSAEASKIAKSAEAKAHPGMALAAVEHGLTLAQFQGQIAALSTAPVRGGALREAMAQSKRLGPDPIVEAQGRGGGLVAAAKRLAAK